MYKLTFLLFVFVSGCLISLSAQTFTNNGANITLTSGSGLTINGGFENLDDGSINNSGDIDLTGDWVNNAASGNLLQGTNGTVSFNGSTLQQIGGATQTWFANLTLQSNTSLSATTSVSGQLQLDGALLTLNNNNLFMGGTAVILGANSSNYIIADANGRLVQWVGSSNINFPIGTSSSFNPVRLNNTGTADQYGARLFEDVLSGGISGSTIPQIDNCVNMSWNISEVNAGGSDLTITAYWTNANEGPSFDRTMAGVGHYTSGSWDAQAAQSATGSPIHSLTRTEITSTGTFAVGDVNSPMAITLDLRMDIKALLEGPFNGTTMNTGLNSAGLIPLAQPFNTVPWNYAGAENVVTFPNANIVDWVLVELRDAPDAASATPASVAGRQAAFLLNDGSIVGMDGASLLQSDAIISNKLFVVIYHRNHLSVMSAVALIQSAGIYTYNFTTAAAQAYGGSSAQNEVSTGKWGMLGGDNNANGSIGAADKNTWKNEAGTYGYQNSDLTFDGQVDNQDKNDVLLENSGKTTQVPQ